MEALAEMTWEEHEVCGRGGAVIRALHFTAETSSRILVTTRG